MNNLTVFENPEFGSIRTVELDGEPWLVGKDVAAALGYKNPQEAIRTHVDEEDKGVSEILTPGGKQPVPVINESGLYSLAATEKEEANVNVNAAAKAATEKPPDGAPPQPPSLEGLENAWLSLGLGRRMGPAVQQAMRSYLAAGLEEGLIAQAMQEAAEHDVKATLPYIRSILDRCLALGIHSLDAWQAAHRGGGAKRVDRETPGGNDFLADAMDRPRRHKRKE